MIDIRAEGACRSLKARSLKGTEHRGWSPRWFAKSRANGVHRSDDGEWLVDEKINDEVIRMLRVHTERRQRRIWKVPQIECQNGVRTDRQGRREDVEVIRIRKRKA